MKMDKDYFLKRVKDRVPSHLEEYSYELLPETFYAHDYVEVICKEHGNFKQKAYHHMQEGGCPKCGRRRARLKLSVIQRLTTEEFVEKARLIHGDKYDYSKVVYETVASMVTIGCPKHGEYVQRAGSHLAGCKCMECFRDEYRLSKEQFLERAKKIHGDKYDYSKVDYVGHKYKVEIICPRHGSFWQPAERHTVQGSGCTFCHESRGEIAVEAFLRKYGIEYIREYRIRPHRYRYDFYLPKLNVYIEFHGHQHYRPVSIFGGEEAHESTKQRDAIKETLVAAAGGRLVVLTYMNLRNGSVEPELILKLKKVFAKWYLINGEIQVFRRTGDVYSAFGIDQKVLVRNLDLEVSKKVQDFKVLF